MVFRPSNEAWQLSIGLKLEGTMKPTVEVTVVGFLVLSDRDISSGVQLCSLPSFNRRFRPYRDLGRNLERLGE